LSKKLNSVDYLTVKKLNYRNKNLNQISLGMFSAWTEVLKVQKFFIYYIFHIRVKTYKCNSVSGRQIDNFLYILICAPNKVSIQCYDFLRINLSTFFSKKLSLWCNKQHYGKINYEMVLIIPGVSNKRPARGSNAAREHQEKLRFLLNVESFSLYFQIYWFLTHNFKINFWCGPQSVWVWDPCIKQFLFFLFWVFFSSQQLYVPSSKC